MFLKMMRIAITFIFFTTMTVLCAAPQAQAQDAPIIIRDAEIENTLREWTEPLTKSAGLPEDSINLILVQNDALNAFVAGGPNIFIYTGLLARSQNPGEVIGVLAHEIGHIRGGHLVRSHGEIRTAGYASVLGTILGIGAAALTGEGQLGTAIALGSQAVATSRFLAFSRVQESSADQAAIAYLSGAGFKANGLVSFLEKLENQELLPASQQTQYIRTHPLTHNRIKSLEHAIESKNLSSNPDFPEEWYEDHRRMVAKLKGFISPERIIWDYDDKDQSIAANYARSIAAYRLNDPVKGLEILEDLLSIEPDNPYFQELKGQILFENGQVEESIQAYRASLNGLGQPNEDLSMIQVSYAHALLESPRKSDEQINTAIKMLHQALQKHPRSTRTHRLLATAYGMKNNDAKARLHLAEESLLKNDLGYAEEQANFALSKFEEGSPDWIRAKDVLHYINKARKK
jgi:predicted Zn-dependent protease